MSWTPEEARLEGYERPQNGGHGKRMAREYRAGYLSMIIVEEGYRAQPWYKPISSEQGGQGDG